MTCECKTELQVKLLERFKETEPEAQDHCAEIQGYAFIFGKTVTLKLATPVHFTGKYLIKKTGLLKEKTTKQNLIFTYCPFCGIRYDEPEEAEHAIDAGEVNS